MIISIRKYTVKIETEFERLYQCRGSLLRWRRCEKRLNRRQLRHRLNKIDKEMYNDIPLR